MSASAIICRPNQILGKRRADDSHSLALCSTEVTRLSSPSDIHRAPVPVPSKHNKLVIVNGKLQIGVKKRYQCTHEGCDKAYSKPSRLAEHERSHTGEVSGVFMNRWFLIQLNTYTSVPTNVKRAGSLICEKLTSTHMRGATSLNHPDHLSVTEEAVKSASGPCNTSKCILDGTRVSNRLL